jgi:hypothetical protein
MMACREPAGKPPYILDLGTRHRWVARIMIWPLNLQGNMISIPAWSQSWCVECDSNKINHKSNSGSSATASHFTQDVNLVFLSSNNQFMPKPFLTIILWNF